jgi:hypothetical protein
MNETSTGALIIGLVFFGGLLIFQLLAIAQRLRAGARLLPSRRLRATLVLGLSITGFGTVVSVLGLLTPSTPTPMTVLDHYTTNNGRTDHIDVSEHGSLHFYQVSQSIYNELHQGRSYVCNVADLPVLGTRFDSCRGGS